MEAKQIVLTALQGSQRMLAFTLSDFTDADMMERPCPGANHAVWQIGHMCKSEGTMMQTLAPEKPPLLPEGFADLFTKQTAANDDPAAFKEFAKKDELLKLYNTIRQTTINWVSESTNEDLSKPTPEKYQAWAKTLGEIAVGQAQHSMMHLGQLQVLRRKLNKPVLF